MHIVIYRPHYAPNFETQFHGPFPTAEEAYDFLCTLPALGAYDETSADFENGFAQSGVKYTAPLTAPGAPA